MSGEQILVWIVIGGIAGIIAEALVGGLRSGLIGAIVVGGMFGDFMLPSIRNGGLELFALFYVQWILLGILVSMTAIERGYRAAASHI